MGYHKLTPVIATNSTEPRYIGDRFADVINVKDFGAVGDGETDDTEAIQAALDACAAGGGGTVVLPIGKYVITTQLTTYANIRFDGQGSTIISNVANGFFLVCEGSFGEEIRLDEKPSVDQGNYSAVTIKTTTNHGLAVGDRIVLQAARDALASDSGLYRTGTPTGDSDTCQWAEVLIVNTVVSSTQIKCTGSLVYPYYLPIRQSGVDISVQPTQRAYTTIRKANFLRGVNICNIVFECYGQNGSDGGAVDNTMLLFACEDAIVKNVTIIKKGEYSHGRGIVLDNCYLSNVIECTIDASNVHHDDVYVAHVYDNHFTFSSCWMCSADSATSIHAGQSFDMTYAGYVDLRVRCPCLYITIKNAKVYGNTDNIATTHSGSWGAIFSGCTFTNFAIGMLLRSPNAIVDHCIFAGGGDEESLSRDYTFAIQLSEPTIWGCRITNNIFTKCRGIRIYPYTSRSGIPSFRQLGINIINNTFFNTFDGIYFDELHKDYAYEDPSAPETSEFTDFACENLDVNIAFNTFFSTVGRVLRVGQLCNGITFVYNDIVNYSNEHGFVAIYELHKNLTMVGNTVSGSGSVNSSIRTLDKTKPRNAKLSPTYTTNDIIYNNINKTLNTAAVYPELWSFSDRDEFFAGETADRNVVIRSSTASNAANTSYRIGLDDMKAVFMFKANTILAPVSGAFSPLPTDMFPSGSLSLGEGSRKWSTVYASSGAISTSDARVKTDILDVQEAVMRAWGRIRFKMFRFIDAVASKGVEKARIHVGVIAQEVDAAFAAEGLDARSFGLFCYDEWPEEWEDVNVSVPDGEGGTKIVAEHKQVATSGNLYSIRYDEALSLESAYQRWLGEKRDTRIAELEARLNEISGNNSASSSSSSDNF